MSSKNGLKNNEIVSRVKKIVMNAKKNNIIKPHTEAFKEVPGIKLTKKMKLEK